MKIYNYVRIDMATGETLEEDFFEYDGPIMLCMPSLGGSDEYGGDDPTGGYSGGSGNDGAVNAAMDALLGVSDVAFSEHDWGQDPSDIYGDVKEEFGMATADVVRGLLTGPMGLLAQGFRSGYEIDRGLRAGLKEAGYQDDVIDDIVGNLLGRGTSADIGGGGSGPGQYAGVWTGEYRGGAANPLAPYTGAGTWGSIRGVPVASTAGTGTGTGTDTLPVVPDTGPGQATNALAAPTSDIDYDKLYKMPLRYAQSFLPSMGAQEGYKWEDFMKDKGHTWLGGENALDRAFSERMAEMGYGKYGDYLESNQRNTLINTLLGGGMNALGGFFS